VQIIASSLILRHATNDRAIKTIKLKPIWIKPNFISQL